jgi:hypothetical protein
LKPIFKHPYPCMRGFAVQFSAKQFRYEWNTLRVPDRVRHMLEAAENVRSDISSLRACQRSATGHALCY